MAKRVSAADRALFNRVRAAGGTVMEENGEPVLMIATAVQARSLSAADRKRLRELSMETARDFEVNGWHAIKRSDPAGLVKRETFLFSPKVDAARADDAIAAAGFIQAAERVDALRRHPDLCATATRLQSKLPVREGWIDANPFWAELARAEALAVAYDAAPRVIRDRDRETVARMGSAKGGRTVAQDAAKRRAEVQRIARDLLAKGIDRRDIAGIIARRTGRPVRTIRRALNKADKA